MIDTSLARIQRLEDLEAIQRLTAVYARCINKWNGKDVELDKLSTVFTPDIHWKNVSMNVDMTGIDKVVDRLRTASAALDLAMHSFTNPIIEVDGDTATGTWLMSVAIKSAGEANDVFLSEDLVYTRTPNGWRIRSVELHLGTRLK